METTATESSFLSTLLFSGGISLTILILFRLLLRRQRKLRKSPSVQSQLAAHRAELSGFEPRLETPLIDAPREITRWHAELHEVARNIQGEIDTKVRLLQATLRQADRAADRLETLIAEVRSEGEVAGLTDLVKQLESLKDELHRSNASPPSAPAVERESS